MEQNGITVAGGNGQGKAINQLYEPLGLCVSHDNETVFIADARNHYITEWKCGMTIGRVVAGGNGLGNRPNQLCRPTDVIFDRERDSVIICDYGNRRVVRWSLQNGSEGEIILSNVGCVKLAIDNDGFLYIVDEDKHEVVRYRMGEDVGTVVAGGNGRGNGLNQLNYPTHIFIDQYHSVYVSDGANRRVMKWMEGAKEGIIVACDQGHQNSLKQLSHPQGIFVDKSGFVYVADQWNHRIMRWSEGSKKVKVIIGGNGQGSQSNQLSHPVGISFDQKGNLYVSDSRNARVQRFSIEDIEQNW
jgi:sugar lactone lactonase YvrE